MNLIVIFSVFTSLMQFSPFARYFSLKHTVLQKIQCLILENEELSGTRGKRRTNKYSKILLFIAQELQRQLCSRKVL